MTRSEEAIIKEFLVGAYMSLQDMHQQDKVYRSERSTMINKELACSQREYDILSALAKQLKVNNPCEK